MKIRDIMTRGVEVVQLKTTVRDAAKKMKDLNVGVLPVCNNDRLQGILTDRDITVRAAAEGRDLSSTKVEDVMSHDVVCCKEDADIKDAAKLMEEKQIRRVPIVDSDSKVIGIVSLGDIATDRDNDLSGEILEKVSEPSRPNK